MMIDFNSIFCNHIRVRANDNITRKNSELLYFCWRFLVDLRSTGVMAGTWFSLLEELDGVQVVASFK